jgi:hypothetical protein
MSLWCSLESPWVGFQVRDGNTPALIAHVEALLQTSQAKTPCCQREVDSFGNCLWFCQFASQAACWQNRSIHLPLTLKPTNEKSHTYVFTSHMVVIVHLPGSPPSRQRGSSARRISNCVLWAIPRQETWYCQTYVTFKGHAVTS